MLEDIRTSNFHGDFILDNIILTPEKKFVLIDWRHDFGGELDWGDAYYDLAKLNHSFTLNHEIIQRGHYNLSHSEKNIQVSIFLKDSLVRMQKSFWNWVTINGYDREKIEILTCIIWLNMAPLHAHPLDQFLYFYGKYNLALKLNSYVKRCRAV